MVGGNIHESQVVKVVETTASNDTDKYYIDSSQPNLLCKHGCRALVPFSDMVEEVWEEVKVENERRNEDCEIRAIGA